MAAETPPDLRVVLLAVVSWAGALAGFLLPGWLNVALLMVGAGWLGVRRRRGHAVLVLTACFVAASAVGCSAMLRVETNRNSPVAGLAQEEAFVDATVRVTSDPLVREGRFEPYVLVRGQVSEVSGRGSTESTRVPILVIADTTWREVELGSRVRASGRLSPPEGVSLAAVLSTSREPVVVGEPGEIFDAATAVRTGIRESVSGAPPAERTLVPALVVGDDQGMPPDVTEAFQVSGLTHLLAVSGTNLTLVVGFVLILARWAGVRALGVAVLLLLLFDPWLALSLGFVLSALATAGILFLAPPWRDALKRWLPRWAAEAIAIPLAAQLVCTPVVAAISGQVSLVAVAANMLVAPAVGPATVCGLVGGLVLLGFEPLGHAIGQGATSCAWWIVAVAEHSAALPTAAVEWSASTASIAGLVVLCVAVGLVLPGLLGRRWPCLITSAVLLAVIVVPLPTPGWPPDDWVMVACDVGQGDGLVVNAGEGRAVVVDAGPDPALIDRCLDRLDVESVPVVVLTHFPADHIDGLPGVLEDRAVGEIDVTGLADPCLLY